LANPLNYFSSKMLDPASQTDVKEAIHTFGMSVVGWYHSHPTFQPDPSQTDIENQATTVSCSMNCISPTRGVSHDPFTVSTDQRHCAESYPFVGLIVGTYYDRQNPTSSSLMRWFHVRDQLHP
jgi:hypothetical protein